VNHSNLVDLIETTELTCRTGKVIEFHGLIIESQGPDAYVGEICEIFAGSRVIQAEVIGFRDKRVLLVPFDHSKGVTIGSEVAATGRSASVRVGSALIGRIIDPLGNPLDGKALEPITTEYPLYPEPVNPMERQPIKERFTTGVNVIDIFTPVGKGQRIGIFAGSGVGKSTLLGAVASNVEGDVNVFVLVGERGREVVEFVNDVLGEEKLARSIVVVATADQHPFIRSSAAYAGTAIAEYFKDQGMDVLLAMDSVTRFANAQRDIGLAAGEPPSVRGYTPSTFTAIPKLVERAGNYQNCGSITAFYTVLVEGDDFNEPVADNMRAILDGHLYLTRERANQGIYPAVDISQSLSRLSTSLCTADELELVAAARRLVAVYDNSKDLIDLGAYTAGSSAEIDKSIEFNSKINSFCSHKSGDYNQYAASINELTGLLA